MSQLRQMMGVIQTWLGGLSTSQKLLFATLAVLAALGLFVVSQYAGKSDMVELRMTGSADERARAVRYLKEHGVAAVAEGTRVMVPAASEYLAIAELSQGNQLPADTKLMFKDLVDKQNWMMPKSQQDQLMSIALWNELSKVINTFPGVTDSSVIVHTPEQRGLGAAVRKSSAQVTVRMRAGAEISQEMVDAMANMVSGSTGVDPGAVSVSDATRGRTYHVRTSEDLAASSYLEHVDKYEKHVEGKVYEALRYINGAIVSVNATVETGRRETRTTKALPKGEGTVSMVKKETSTQNTQSAPKSGAAAGLRSNVGDDVSSGTGAGAVSSQEQSDKEYDNSIGKSETVEVDPKGRPTKVHVAVSVPRDWVVQIARERMTKADPAAASGGTAAPAEPTAAQVTDVWEKEEGPRIKELVQRLVRDQGVAEAGADAAKTADSVTVSLIPVPLGLPPVGSSGGAGGTRSGETIGGGSGFMGSLVQGGVVKLALLGGLAVLSLGMMVMMVKKAGRSEPLPSAEQLVGIPPTLPSNSDLIGEAEAGETAMVGIEIEDGQLKTQKMLEQVSDLIKKNPRDAASLFNRWLSVET